MCLGQKLCSALTVGGWSGHAVPQPRGLGEGDPAAPVVAERTAQVWGQWVEAWELTLLMADWATKQRH